jgi:hypothetical protein
MAFAWAIAGMLGQDFVAQLLAEFDAPPIEADDPNHTFGTSDMICNFLGLHLFLLILDRLRCLLHGRDHSLDVRQDLLRDGHHGLSRRNHGICERKDLLHGGDHGLHQIKDLFHDGDHGLRH